MACSQPWPRWEVTLPAPLRSAACCVAALAVEEAAGWSRAAEDPPGFAGVAEVDEKAAPLAVEGPPGLAAVDAMDVDEEAESALDSTSCLGQSSHRGACRPRGLLGQKAGQLGYIALHMSHCACVYTCKATAELGQPTFSCILEASIRLHTEHLGVHPMLSIHDNDVMQHRAKPHLGRASAVEVFQNSCDWVRPAAQGWRLSTHSVRQGIKLADAGRCLHSTMPVDEPCAYLPDPQRIVCIQATGTSADRQLQRYNIGAVLSVDSKEGAPRRERARVRGALLGFCPCRGRSPPILVDQATSCSKQ